jgi:hypothetical protein
MTTHAKEKLTMLSAAFPILWLSLLYLFVIRARLHFGHWPSAADGMAKYMGFTLHHSLAVYALLLSPFVAIVVVVVAFIFRRKDSQFRMARPLTILAAAVLFCATLVATDPGRFILWFID